jgi:catalase
MAKPPKHTAGKTAPALDHALHDHQPGAGHPAYATTAGNGGKPIRMPQPAHRQKPTSLTTSGTAWPTTRTASRPVRGRLLEDFVLREKIFHFDHERIPEHRPRAVRARMACLK